MSGTTKPRKKTTRLWLNSMTNARRSLARLIRDLHDDPQADTTWYRAQGYLMKILLDYFVAERDQNHEQRLAALEAVTEAMKRDAKARGPAEAA